jgi:hypothetical protein
LLLSGMGGLMLFRQRRLSESSLRSDASGRLPYRGPGKAK